MRLNLFTIAVVLVATAGVAPADEAVVAPHHHEPRLGLDLRASVPDGVGATVTLTRDPRFTFGLGLGTLLGTVALTPEATYNILPGRRCTPTLTVKASTVVFTPLMDGLINDQLARIYGNQVTVDMAGRVMEIGQGLAGVDCALASVHFVARAGYAWQLGRSFGGDDALGDLVIRNWHGPTIDLGLRWSL